MQKQTCNKQKILNALKRSIVIPDESDPNRELWQIAQNQIAGYFFGAISMGEFDE